MKKKRLLLKEKRRRSQKESKKDKFPNQESSEGLEDDPLIAIGLSGESVEDFAQQFFERVEEIKVKKSFR